MNAPPGILKTVQPEDIFEIFLQPGDFFWGDRYSRIQTLLGSCVSITVWHRKFTVGGMCHIMLPERFSRKADEKPNGRYLREALELFQAEMKRVDPNPSHYQIKLFGGGNISPAFSSDLGIARRNLALVRELLAQNNWHIEAESTGGNRYRRIKFEVWSGRVLMKEQAISQVPVQFRESGIQPETTGASSGN